MIDQSASRDRLAKARKIAKENGADILGWNDKPGKECISLQIAAEDVRNALQAELEAEDWHLWPQVDSSADNFMDFKLEPPPNDSGKREEYSPGHDETMAESGAEFHYRGINQGLTGILVLAACVAFVAFASKHQPPWPSSYRWILAIAAFLLVASIFLVLSWTEISADDRQVSIRKRFFGRRETVPISNIKRIKPFTLVDTRGRKSVSLAIDLHRGKGLDVLLPKRKQDEFYAFIKRRVSDGKSSAR